MTAPTARRRAIAGSPSPAIRKRSRGRNTIPSTTRWSLNKQAESIRAMDERNAMRVKHFKETGEFVFDVSKIKADGANDGSTAQ
ncbi:hypothetical protein [Jiella pelagia]|uniref:hypothetical protein n=1 Tax=Jiella pelagia TaxID=2986949 RepID=UPI0038B3F7FE